MESTLTSIERRLERIELLLEQLIPQSTEKIFIKKSTFKSKIPTDDEMDAYLMKHVFSEKK
ncbi:hypothetical protein VBZ51_08290 [Maribacter sp. HS]|uniref:hypothetical protein n=1 Tax=Maribacter sp. HS TaxID=3110480 RepID=UPI003A853651